MPQTVLFSATFDEVVMDNIQKFIDCKAFRIQKEALKLKGVKMFRIRVQPSYKMEFINEVYSQFQMD